MYICLVIKCTRSREFIDATTTSQKSSFSNASLVRHYGIITIMLSLTILYKNKVTRIFATF